MKKKLLFPIFLISLVSFAQSNTDKIRKHLNDDQSKLKLSKTEIDNIIVSDEFVTTSNVTVCHVKQTFNGIPVFNNDSNFLIHPSGKISGKNKFIKDFSTNAKKLTQKIDLNSALKIALNSTNDRVDEFSVSKFENNKFKLQSKNTNNQFINGQLVYYYTPKNELKLSYFFEYYSNIGDKDLWNIFIDAENGTIIEKENKTIKCTFHKKHDFSTNDHSLIFKNQDNNIELTKKNALLNPGTTSYKVIPWNYESPNHYKAAFPSATDGRTIVTNPESTTALAPLSVAASPNGWHNNNGTIGGSSNPTTFNHTQGNNVFAYSDYTNSNPPSPSTFTTASSGTYPNLNFDYSYSGLTSTPANNIDAAITNLFYMNNIMHDLWYQYGFNEINKNFQDKNYSRGGAEGDYVLAEAQDASQKPTPSYNNANFSTPIDGSKPRMQMYLWEHTDPIKVQITSGSLSGTTYLAIDNSFTAGHVELPITPTNMSGQIVLFVDNNSDGVSTDPNDACSPATTSLTNKIVVVRRGNCNFTAKVIAAQNAGAKAVIIVNNSNTAWGIGGGDAGVTIPAIGLSKIDGDALINALTNEGSINTTLINSNSNIYADGDFDNGIIAHEYGHGISTRLSGNCLSSSEQMGEGWSDWFWLMMQIKPGDTGTDKRGIGTFASNQPTNGPGIRRYPYSTDMSVNPQTYAVISTMWYTDTSVTPNVDRVDVHSVGSVWATILWDLAWAYIGKYGYDSNIYNGTGGNNKVMKIVLDGIKIDGCAPSFISGRDAILEADQITTGGADYELIWRVFARRGVGYSANSGVSNVGVDGLRDNPTTLYTDLPPTLAKEDFINPNSINIYPNPTNGNLNISIDRDVTDSVITIVDLNGRVVYSENTQSISGVKTLNLNQLQSGIYILNIKGENINHSQKIILN
ncbi:T9SS-dependent M36 family metallopeptidase [Flavobacterium luminosum]|uniref:T9SS-dependent M36 family metallopeptidase n=1 Tax=Flavobacterium luminosum TaxID=2949086 RepID=A0ABT0TKZ4_9FLAO|nr:T9SS-dependent M36 family metallopeptidase [Flavobacterium sp. HXWNR70]MCL9808151.1 T9SS-dependent M36 family metallopeptidase [Flavobacterium sp. HXWNR70]